MRLVRHRWKLQIDLLVFVGCNQACSGMPKILRNNKYPLSPFFYIGFCFKYSESTWSSQLPFSKRFLGFLVYKLISWRVIKRLSLVFYVLQARRFSFLSAKLLHLIAVYYILNYVYYLLFGCPHGILPTIIEEAASLTSC